MYINCYCCKICIWCWRIKTKEERRKARKEKRVKKMKIKKI